jgi:ketosteroid isomerase-like protein
VASSELELVEHAFKLLNSESYEQALELVDERFEMTTTSEVASEPGVYRGHDGVRRWWESFLEVMDYVALDAKSLEAAGEGRVIVEFAIRARGRRSGIEAQQPANALATVSDGRLMRLEFFTSVERAREAAGLPPR